MKLLLDEMLPPVIAEQLRMRGHDVDSVATRQDLVEQSDSFIYTVAQQEYRAIVTENIDHFRVIASDELAGGRRHAGLIFTNARTLSRGHPRTIGRIVTALTELLEANEDLSDREIWLS